MSKKILFIFTIVSLFICMFIFRHYFEIFYFQSDLNKLAINLETTQKAQIYACFNGNCDKMQYDSGIYSYKLAKDKPIFYEDIVENIELVSDKPFKIEALSLFSSGKLYYFTNDEIIQNEVSFNSSPAYSINIPYQNNNKNFIQKISVYFESVFYNWYFYIAFYVLLIIYVIKYKPKININIYMVLLLALILRLSHINFIPLWNDELYSLCHISNMANGFNLKNIFIDPGNPPLFFAISNIWLYFFNKSIIQIRFLPLLIGLFGVWSIYYILNILLNKKTALCASFLFAINILAILQSNEIRSYIFSMTLLLWSMFYFYKLKNDFSTKNLIIYSFISMILINSHYYCFLYILFNFIFGLFIFKTERLKYSISNIFAFLTFIPYFIISRNVALSESFNTWISKPTLDVLYNHIIFYFGNLLFFISVIAFCIFAFKKLENQEKSIFIYTLSSITFVFVCAFLISILIKPILFERYFCIFLPYLIINTAIFLNLKLNPALVILMFLFSINMPKYENFNLFSNVDFALRYGIKDSQNYKNADILYVIPDNIDYIKYYEKIKKENVIVLNFEAREDVDLVEFYLSKAKKKKTIIYLPEMCTNLQMKYSKMLNLKKINTTIVPIYKLVIE